VRLKYLLKITTCCHATPCNWAESKNISEEPAACSSTRERTTRYHMSRCGIPHSDSNEELKRFLLLHLSFFHEYRLHGQVTEMSVWRWFLRYQVIRQIWNCRFCLRKMSDAISRPSFFRVGYFDPEDTGSIYLRNVGDRTESNRFLACVRCDIDYPPNSTEQLSSWDTKI